MDILKGAEFLSIKLEDGAGHYMGDGLFVVLQRDPEAKGRKTQNVVVTSGELASFRAAQSDLNVILEDGEAHHMGDGLYIVMQRDRTRRGEPMQNVMLTANDAAALLALAA